MFMFTHKMFDFQLILSLEKRLMEVSETLEKVGKGFVEKSAEVEALQIKSDDQVGLGFVDSL